MKSKNIFDPTKNKRFFESGKEDIFQKAKEHVYKKSEEDNGGKIVIKGLDIEGEVGVKELIDSYLTTGFQATNLAKSVEVIKKCGKRK